MLETVKKFFADVRVEYKRISWPSRKQLMASTLTVIVMTFVLAVYIGVVDAGLLKAVNFILR